VQEAPNVPVGQRLTVHESDVASVPIGSAPAAVRVASISPNPFSASTKIVLEAPGAGSIEACIYDVAGGLVAPLAIGGDRTLEWSGTDASGIEVPPGIYFLRLAGAGGCRATTCKIIRLK
jgi:hypothetical protein